MTTIRVQDHSSAIKDVFYLINEHFFSGDKRDIAVILDRKDTLDILEFLRESHIDHETKVVDIRGDYFYVTSSAVASELFVESVKTEDGEIKGHEGDILILPHYVPQEVKEACIDGSAVVIELALESIYEDLVKIIENQ